MRAYIVLGTAGAGVYEVKHALSQLLEKIVTLETTDKTDFSSTFFYFEVETVKEARQLLAKAFKWLRQQRWYHDDSKVSFARSGLIDEDESDWYCEICGGDMDECECGAGNKAVKTRAAEVGHAILEPKLARDAT